MDNRRWLDRVRERLARQSLPPGYVQRFMEELTDHLSDLKEENMEADPISRLGEPEQLADQAVTAYRRHGYLGRHPWAALLVFGVSPIVSLAAAVALVCVGLSVLSDWDRSIVAGLSHFGGSGSMVGRWLASLVLVVVPSSLVSVLYCWLGGRSGVGKRWVVVSCAVLAVLAALPMITAKVSAVPGESWLRIGLWVPGLVGHWYYFFAWTFCRPQQFVQFLAPLVFGAWFLWHMNAKRRLKFAS